LKKNIWTITLRISISIRELRTNINLARNRLKWIGKELLRRESPGTLEEAWKSSRRITK
jgi:hypothetical protein